MTTHEITVVKKISINPVSYTRFEQVYKSYSTDLEEKKVDKQKTNRPTQFLNNKVNDFKLSLNAAKNLRNKINWLYFLSDKKIIATSSGHNYEFRIAFVTLTLPSVQKCKTSEINNCLILLLNQMRNKYKLKNYVWRLEFQKNGNAHYHICTDTYISQGTWRYHWNKLINKLGFIDEYEKERKDLSFRDYVKKYASNGQTSLLTAKNRYKFGKKTKWRAPKTADVRNAYNSKNVAFYISKYFSKEDKRVSIIKQAIAETEKKQDLPPWEKENIIANLKAELTILETKEKAYQLIISNRELTSSNIRLWYCSQNLSKIVNLSYFEESNESNEINQLLDQVIIDFTFSDTYFSYFKFDYDKQNNYFKYNFKKLLRLHAEELGYYSD